MKYCCLCCLVFAKFCFVGWFLRVSVLVRTNSFRKKKNKQAWNSLDNLILLYYWPPPALSSTLTTFDCFTFPSHFYHECYGFEWAFFTHRCFLPYAPSQHLAQPAFIKASLGAGSSSLKVAGPPTEVWNIDPAHLFVWITQRKVQHKVLIGRFCLRVTTGRLMKNHL